MTKWHTHVAHMAKHMNMVGDPEPGRLGAPSESGAANTKSRDSITGKRLFKKSPHKAFQEKIKVSKCIVFFCQKTAFCTVNRLHSIAYSMG